MYSYKVTASNKHGIVCEYPVFLALFVKLCLRGTLRGGREGIPFAHMTYVPGKVLRGAQCKIQKASGAELPISRETPAQCIEPIHGA